MKPGVRNGLGALAIASVLGTAYVLNFGFYPRFFDIAWDEEVRLHDGRLILVHIKRRYERREISFERYPKNPRQVAMSFSFDTGTGKRFEHTFKRGTLNFLDEQNGKWYVGYHSDGSDPSVEIGNQMLYPHVAVLSVDGAFSKPRSWSDVPKEITRANILPATPNPKSISEFNGTRLGDSQKMAHWANFPTGAGWGTITRITPQPVN